MKRLLSLVITLAFALILSSTLTFAAEQKAPAKPAAPAAQKAPENKELLDINTASPATNTTKALQEICKAFFSSLS